MKHYCLDCKAEKSRFGNYCKKCICNYRIQPKRGKGTYKLTVQNKGWFKKGQIPLGMVGENHPNWKGDLAGYYALHSRIKRKLGKATKCRKCGSERNVWWSNVSGLYLSILSDWEELCVSCHKLKDLDEVKEGKRKPTNQLFAEQGRSGY